MKHFILILFCFASLQGLGQVYTSKSINSTLYSEAPIENIEATSTKGVSVLNSATAEMQFSIAINSYQFAKSLMQEHFNENYMESDKYPFARFKGKINEKIDYSKNGEYPVTVSGELEVHGVKKQRTIPGMITINNNRLSIQSKFTVLCVDHQISIPKLVFKNIAESIQVTIKGAYSLSSPTK